MKADKIKINYMYEPVGIESGKVIISWVAKNGVKQSAFIIKMYVKGITVYESEKVYSNKTEFVPDFTVPSKSRVKAEITLFDEKGTEGEVSSAYFETGLNKEDIKAKWINPELNLPAFYSSALNNTPLNKASYLVKRFNCSNKENARLYITSHGFYDVYINGKHVDGYLYAPGHTQYDLHLQMQTYDIEDKLNTGENEIIVSLGDGAWRGSFGWGMERYLAGRDIALLCQLEVNGEVVLISDETWLASNNGPLGFNDTMRLEEYDARKEITDLHEVKVENFGVNTITGSCLPVTMHERFKAKVIITPKNEKVLDFGQNIAGFVEINLKAKGGEVISLNHTETLDEEGNYQNLSFQNPDVPHCDQKIIYTCKNGENLWHPTKCYYGFRYVMVETDLDITGEEFTAVAVYSDMETTAEFECGIDDVNKLFKNTLWSMKGNFVDVPTDCPTREKAGFTGDCQVFSDTAMYLMDSYPVLIRWLKDQALSQFENGCVKQMLPKVCPPDFYDGSAGWCDSFEIVPYRIMKRLDSTELVKELYPNIRKWGRFLIERAKAYRPENENMPVYYRDYFVDSANHWGEWCEPGVSPYDYFAERDLSGHPELGTAFLALACKLISEMAEKLGEKEDAVFFREAFSRARESYRYAFIKNGRVEGERQCLYVRAIAHDLLNEDEKYICAKDLAEVIKRNGNKLGTGFLSTCELCNVLADYNQAETAFNLLLQTEQPSWLFEVKSGATTMWESWFGIGLDKKPIGSFNHYSFGSVSGFIMSRVLGIKHEFGKVTIKPFTDKRLGFAKGYYDSPSGRIYSSWEYRNGKIIFDFEIPSNCEAEIILPSGKTQTVNTGKYHFEADE